MIKNTLGPWALFSFAILASASALNASSISIGNAGFQTPAAPFNNPDVCANNGRPVSSDYIYDPSNCGQVWTFEDNSGIAYSDGGGFFSPVSPDGSQQAAFLQTQSDFFQTISGFTPGEVLVLQFYAAARTNGCATGSCTEAQTVSVFLGSNQLTFGGSSSVQPGTGYTLYTTDPFVAASSSYTLKFEGNGFNGEDVSAFIDEVSGTATAPEPATLATAGALTFLVALARRKRLARR